MSITPGVTACDVLVIGGGPAGSTAAALLAERGCDVVIVEQAQHPRFHIGESLLPANMPMLERMGLTKEVAAIGVFKPGAEFVDDRTGRSSVFSFNLSLNRAATSAYQVPRAAFDAILFDNARRKGARAEERMCVTGVELGKPGERAHVAAIRDGVHESYAPRFILDATGRDTLMATKLGLKKANKFNSTAAVYAHWRGVAMEMNADPGYISVHLAEDGWFWMIPLPDGVMSVGFVGNADVFKGRSGSAKDLYLERLRNSPSVAGRMTGAEQIGDITATGNYSYRATTAHGQGWMAIGDAFAFLDPIFSSGVLLAMTSGQLGADVAQSWLRRPAEGVAAAKRAERQICGAMDSLGWLVYRINTPVLRAMFMSPSNHFRMRDGLVAMLAGNLKIDRQLRGPVLAFKTVYYVLSGLVRLGWDPQNIARRGTLGPIPQPAVSTR
jgi:flavin-dependent dehydrogenase